MGDRHVRATRLLLGGESKSELKAKRCGDPLVHEGADPLAGNDPGEFTDQVPVGKRVVAPLRADRPHRSLALDRVDHRLPVVSIPRLRGEGARDPRQMREHVIDGSQCLSRLGIGRPKRCHRRCEPDAGFA